MYGTPAPAPRSSFGPDSESDLAPASELSETGLLSEEEVITPRLLDRPADRPRPPGATDAPKPWIGMAFAGAVATVLALWVGAAAFAAVALAFWQMGS